MHIIFFYDSNLMNEIIHVHVSEYKCSFKKKNLKIDLKFNLIQKINK